MARHVIAGALRRRQESALLLGAAAILVVVALAPLLWPSIDLFGSRADSAGAGLAALGAAGTWALLLRSLVLSGAVTLVALLLGTTLAVPLARTDVGGRRAVLLLCCFPLFLPPFLLALGWFHLFGQQGYLGGALTARLLFSEVGVIAVLALTFAPVAALLVCLALWNVDPSLEEAARVVAGPLRVVTRILLPAARPAVALAAIVIFALALSELGVPMFLRVKVYPAAVFTRLGGVSFAPGEALLLTLPLLPVALGLLGIERRVLGRRSFALLGLRGREQAPIPLGRWRRPVSCACWAAALVAVAPIACLVLRALDQQGFARVLDWIGSSLLTSLASSAAAATLVTVVSVVVGHAVARQRAGAAALDAITVLTFLAPAAVLGVGLIAVWNRPSTRLIYDGLGILVVGYMARYSVIGIRTVATSMVQSSPHFEEAAAAHGGGYLRRLLGILLPMHRRGVAGAWLLTLVFCLRDLETAVLYYPPGKETLTVRIFTLEANGPGGVVAALAVIQVAVTAAALGASFWLLGPRGKRP